MQKVADALLHLGRVLGGGGHLNRPILPGLGKGRIHLQVKVFLPTERERPLHGPRRLFQTLCGVSPAHEIGRSVKAAGRHRLFHREDRLLFLVLHHHLGRRLPTNLRRFPHHQGHQLTVETDLLVGKERLVMDDGTGVVPPGDILGH